MTHPHVSRLHRYAPNDERRSTPAQHTLNHRSTPVSGVECPRLRISFASFPVYSSGLFGESLRDGGIIFASMFRDCFLLFLFFFNKIIHLFLIILIYLLYVKMIILYDVN